jgi:hypothetical protein
LCDRFLNVVRDTTRFEASLISHFTISNSTTAYRCRSYQSSMGEARVRRSKGSPAMDQDDPLVGTVLIAIAPPGMLPEHDSSSTISVRVALTRSHWIIAVLSACIVGLVGLLVLLAVSHDNVLENGHAYHRRMSGIDGFGGDGFFADRDHSLHKSFQNALSLHLLHQRVAMLKSPLARQRSSLRRGNSTLLTSGAGLDADYEGPRQVDGEEGEGYSSAVDHMAKLIRGATEESSREMDAIWARFARVSDFGEVDFPDGPTGELAVNADEATSGDEASSKKLSGSAIGEAGNVNSVGDKSSPDTGHSAHDFDDVVRIAREARNPSPVQLRVLV